MRGRDRDSTGPYPGTRSRRGKVAAAPTARNWTRAGRVAVGSGPVADGDGEHRGVLEVGAAGAGVKRVPGRKTDVSDSQWLATLARYGLVSPSFLAPPKLEEFAASDAPVRTAASENTSGRVPAHAQRDDT